LHFSGKSRRDIVFTSESCSLGECDEEAACLGLFRSSVFDADAQGSRLSVAQARADGSVRFLVVVTTKSGQPVADLRQQDFTVFDDDVIRPIRSFRTILAAKKQGGSHTFTAASMSNLPGEPMAIGISVTYEVVFDGAKSSGRREFHEVGIKVDRPNLEIATRPGYLTSAY
jgi:hypothetical protein